MNLFREAAKKSIFFIGPTTKALTIPPPLELSVFTFQSFFGFFLGLQRNVFFLSGHALTPPSLSQWLATKKIFFFAASLTNMENINFLFWNYRMTGQRRKELPQNMWMLQVIFFQGFSLSGKEKPQGFGSGTEYFVRIRIQVILFSPNIN